MHRPHSVAPSDRHRLFSGGFTAFQTEMDATIYELKTMAEGIAKTPDAFDGLTHKVDCRALGPRLYTGAGRYWYWSVGIPWLE